MVTLVQLVRMPRCGRGGPQFKSEMLPVICTFWKVRIAAIAEVLKTSGTSVHVGSSPTPSVELETSDGSPETKTRG